MHKKRPSRPGFLPFWPDSLCLGALVVRANPCSPPRHKDTKNRNGNLVAAVLPLVDPQNPCFQWNLWSPWLFFFSHGFHGLTWGGIAATKIRTMRILVSWCLGG